VTLILVVLVVALALLVVTLGVMLVIERIRRGGDRPPPRTRRILFPFVAQALSAQALDAALRIANAEEATLVPVFLCRVSLDLPLETPLPRQSRTAIPLQEAIEHRAAEFDVPVDARIERGRSYRHALRHTIAHERYDRLVIAAAAHGNPGFDADDVAWLLDHAPGEIVVLRPGADDQLRPPAPSGKRRRARATRQYEQAASR
jgi:hypothetical protein